MDTTTMNELQARVPGWGVDKDPQSRPGYPLYQEFHAPHDTLEGQSPTTQTVPLKGLSGLLRHAAYKLPDWKPRRWMLLMMADRMDAFEHNLPRNLLIAGGVGGLVAALGMRLKKR